MSMRVAVGSLHAIAFLAALVWLTVQQARVRCEVCMGYGGRTLCETAAAADRDQAIAQARNAACARLSSGVTGGIACNNAPPLSVSCSGP